jgi:hypothetical protein
MFEMSSGALSRALFVLLLAAGCAEDRAPRNDARETDAGKLPPVASAESDAHAVGDASLASDAGGASDESRDAGGEEPAADIPAERAALCARQADDAVRDVFCKGTNPTVTGLRELARRLKLSALRPEVDETAAAAIEIDPFEAINTVVFLGLSTALSGQLVSPINPRAILFNGETALAFQRGVQKVEIATRDRVSTRLNFYLVSFKQACNQKSQGCLPGDLFTLTVESDWSSLTLEDEEDLKNTPLDCRLCHQRGSGPSTLLMRELKGPWTHFFGGVSSAESYDAGLSISGTDLVADYMAAKGSESYAGIPAVFMSHTVGGTLQLAVDNAQPIEFDAPTIADELNETAAQGKPGRSATWDNAYAAFKRGEQLALPHFAPRPTDANKQAALSEAYARYRRHEITADALPDLSDIFPDDAKLRAEIGLATEPDATPSEALIQACGSCHNDVLDQTLSRARFNVALARMSRAELDVAIARIELPSTDPAAMPPKGMRQLAPEAKKRLLLYLKQSERPAADEAALESAAKVGMAKPRADYPRL